MKKIISILTLFITFLGHSQPKTDLQKENLRGNVLSVREIAYEVTYNEQGQMVNGEIEDNTALNSLIIFNKQGYITENIFYDIENKEESRVKITHFTTQGARQEAVWEEKGGVSTKATFQYDEKGNLSEEILHHKEGNHHSKYKYDEKGNLIKINFTIKSLESDFIFEYLFKYNKKNQVIEEISYNKDKQMISKILKKYNKQGDYIKKTELFPDENSKKKEKLSKVTHSYQYTYDKNGNWIKKIEYQGKEPIQIYEREIKYF